MNKPLIEKLFEGRNKWWLLLFVSFIFIAYQLDNTPRTDDEYLGEQVYWLLHNGKVKTDLGYSQYGYDIYQSIFHKLFIYAGYGFSRLFGWSLYSLHAISLLCFPLFVVVFYRYVKSVYGSGNNYHFFAVLILLLLNQDLLYAAGDFRPEIMIMGLGFTAYVLLTQYLREGKYSVLIASAVCAGLCMFAHLNGSIFIIAGCLLLAAKNQFRAALLYGVAAFIAFAPYFADVFLHAGLGYFWHQFTHDPILHQQTAHWYDPVLKVLNEQTRFLFTEKQVILTATLLLVLLFSYKKLKQSHAALLLYTAILILSLAVICPSKSTKYMVLYLPFLYILLVEGWAYIEAGGRRGKVLAVRSLLFAGSLLSLLYSGRQIYENVINIRTGGIVAEHSAILNSILEEHAKLSLLGPRVMVFNELGKFRQIQDIEMITKDNFRSFVLSSGISFVVFSKRDETYFDLPGLLKEDAERFRLTDSTAHYKLVQIRR